MKKIIALACFIGVFVTLQSCASASLYQVDSEQQQATVLAMYNEVMESLQETTPVLSETLKSAPGHAVINFGNVTALIGYGRGLGVVKDQRSGEMTFIKRDELRVGLGVGIRDYKEVIVFEDEQALDHFLESGEVTTHNQTMTLHTVDADGLAINLLFVSGVFYRLAGN